MHKYILFDLDGTLTDSSEGITKSVQYALRKMGYQADDRKALEVFIGPHLTDAGMEYYGMTREEGERFLGYYREMYSVIGVSGNRIYDGIKELLEALNQAGHTAIVATSKPEEFAVKILAEFGLSQWFSRIVGNTLDDLRPTKAAVIAEALSGAGINRQTAVMVGDRKYDIIGAKENQIPSIGVLFGFGSKEELTSAGADFLVQSVNELQDLLLSGSTGNIRCNPDNS